MRMYENVWRYWIHLLHGNPKIALGCLCCLFFALVFLLNMADLRFHLEFRGCSNYRPGWVGVDCQLQLLEGSCGWWLVSGQPHYRHMFCLWASSVASGFVFHVGEVVQFSGDICTYIYTFIVYSFIYLLYVCLISTQNEEIKRTKLIVDFKEWVCCSTREDDANWLLYFWDMWLSHRVSSLSYHILMFPHFVSVETETQSVNLLKYKCTDTILSNYQSMVYNGHIISVFFAELKGWDVSMCIYVYILCIYIYTVFICVCVCLLVWVCIKFNCHMLE